MLCQYWWLPVLVASFFGWNVEVDRWIFCTECFSIGDGQYMGEIWHRIVSCKIWCPPSSPSHPVHPHPPTPHPMYFWLRHGCTQYDGGLQLCSRLCLTHRLACHFTSLVIFMLHFNAMLFKCKSCVCVCGGGDVGL